MTTVIAGARKLDGSAEPGLGLAPGLGPGGVEATGRWRIVPVGPGDRAAVESLFPRCSAETVRLRFFGRPRAFPARYLEDVLAGRPEAHDAVLAYASAPATVGAGGQPGSRPASPVGLAGLAAAPEPDLAELGVLVADGFQRQGVGAAMVAALLGRARARGVGRVAASVLPGRSALLAAMARRVGLLPAADGSSPAGGAPRPRQGPPPVTYEWGGDYLTAVYTLGPPAPHPPRFQGGPR